jgi:hypothetical protein
MAKMMTGYFQVYFARIIFHPLLDAANGYWLSGKSPFRHLINHGLLSIYLTDYEVSQQKHTQKLPEVVAFGRYKNYHLLSALSDIQTAD